MTTTQEAPTTALIAVPDVPPAELFTQVNIDELIAVVRARVAEFEGDVSTKSGRDKIASMAHKVARSKTLVEDIGKALVKPMKDKAKLVDALRKKWKEELDDIKNEVRKPLNEFEQAERERVNEHNMRLIEIRSFRDTLEGMTVEQLEKNRSRATELKDRDWEEFADAADEACIATHAKLNERIKARKQYESEREELAKLREREDARKIKEREEQIAKEATEKAEREATAKAKAEAERVEREKAYAEAKANAERGRLERERKDAEARAERAAQDERNKIEAKQKAEAEEKARRESDKKHKSSIETTILRAFIDGGMKQEAAVEALGLIVDRKIPNVTINY